MTVAQIEKGEPVEIRISEGVLGQVYTTLVVPGEVTVNGRDIVFAIWNTGALSAWPRHRGDPADLKTFVSRAIGEEWPEARAKTKTAIRKALR